MAQEKEKKAKYLQRCLDQRHHFSPFMMSVDGMLGKEAAMLLKKKSKKLVQKWECSPGLAANYVKTTMSLFIIHAIHHCLGGARVSSQIMSTCCYPCEDGAAIGLLLSCDE
eukprot:7154549-Ditylum_brightwellii.AAC.1